MSPLAALHGGRRAAGLGGGELVSAGQVCVWHPEVEGLCGAAGLAGSQAGFLESSPRYSVGSWQIYEALSRWGGAQRPGGGCGGCADWAGLDWGMTDGGGE